MRADVIQIKLPFLLCSLGCKDLSITHITRWMLVALRTFKNNIFLLFCWHKRILGVLITRSLSWLKLRTWNTFSNKAVSCVLMLSVSSWQHVNKVNGKLFFFRACVTVTLKIFIAIKHIVQPKKIIMSSFTHVVPKLYAFLSSAKHKIKIFKET